jgi:lincosamide nucleotidyltransferase A/C/D/E
VLDPFTFPVEALAGRDSIAGTDVRCESPEWAVQRRTGYPPRPNDLHDVPLLSARFGIPLPAGF